MMMGRGEKGGNEVLSSYQIAIVSFRSRLPAAYESLASEGPNVYEYRSACQHTTL
jgi:hypothetical protein